MSELFDKLGLKPLCDENVAEVTSVLPTNIIPLDVALGIGGFPRGRISTIIGQPSVGKSSICARLISNNQKCGGYTLIIDSEFSYEIVRLKQFGVDVSDKKLAILREYNGEPVCLEDVEKIFKEILKTVTPKEKMLIICDTLSGLPVRTELEGDRDPEKVIGVHSRVLSRMFRIITNLIAETQTTFIIVAQPKIDPMFGNATFIGEKPIKFHSSIIVDFSRESKDEKRMNIKFNVTKNKVATPFKTGKFTYFLNLNKFDYISNYVDFVGKSAQHYYWSQKPYPKTSAELLLIDNKKEVESLIRSKLERPLDYQIYIDKVEEVVENKIEQVDPETGEVLLVE